MTDARNRPSSRQLRKTVSEILRRDDYRDAVREMDFQRVVGPLFSHFHAPDEIIRWRAVSAMGTIVAEQAESGKPEPARVIMRRFMWNLNDESGGIGWGCPEAMGETMARNPLLADEFHRILTSYAWEEGNYLEHPRLQHGVLWGIGRLAHARPERIAYAAPWLAPFARSGDPGHRGLAAWALGPLDDPETRAVLESLRDDPGGVRLFDPETDRLADRSVGELARAALARRDG